MRKIPKSYMFFTIILIVIIVTSFSLWGINKYQNEKWYEEEYAKIFDESMTASYPLLMNVANAFAVQATFLRENAIYAQRHSHNKEEFAEIFTQINRQRNNTQEDDWRSYWTTQYSHFRTSIPYGRLSNGSKLRETESRAFSKIEYTQHVFFNWYEYDPDSLIVAYQNIKILLNEAIRDLDKYRHSNQDVNAWRNIGPEDSYILYEKYTSRKNWPFLFLNDNE